ncbi:hypothetical protein DL766_004421 [Monosporascus sp. MC13-8B]|uniref:Uncharacterized protein n=1 Tax=Monosporascus cannonballus TaxID=155416 RepID=A0ABY0HA59_9PEZI|nr:hypothetical protein DL762_003625 [Monosporascus cannonballus]RYO98701.1 hypothetical protein DL763_001962 [Monosporascus cannonballus]RYP31368.1 hypothetical protein DL766_004421 [Monosporascus sp. MC13-8B]
MLPGVGVLTGAVTVADLRRILEAGFTNIRELSEHTGYQGPGIQEGDIIGPIVYFSLTFLSITGDHGDI